MNRDFMASGDAIVCGSRFASCMWCATIVAAALVGLSSHGEAGLIANWAFEENVNDSTATYNATAVNSPAYAPGVIGQAISLNGVNQYATVPNMGTYANASVSVWVRTRDANSPLSQAIFHSTTYTNGTPHFLLEYGRDLTVTGLVIDVMTAEIKRNGANSPINENTWYNVAYSYDRSVPSLRLFINGSEVGSAGGNNTVNLNLTSMFIGAGFSRPFNGLIDDLSVWNETLSATKFKGIYSFATSSVFNYGQADVARLYGLSSGQTATTSDNVTWRYATDLTGVAGEVQSLGGGLYAMNLGGGSGVQTVAPVPEPSTYAMALAGLACGGYLVRRRRRSVSGERPPSTSRA
jgi:hypothetical protein